MTRSEHAQTMTEQEYQDAVEKLSAYPKKTLERYFAINESIYALCYAQYERFPTKQNAHKLFACIVQKEIYIDALTRKLWKDMRNIFFGVRITELKQQYS